jgi:hypothetical protein
MGKVKELLMTAEDMLSDLLNEQGMTNDQALRTIEEKLGKLARGGAEALLEKWKDEDNGI